MDEINSKIVMPSENHMYMDESYKMDEIFGWMCNMNEFLDDNWKWMILLDETLDWLNVWMKIIPKQLWRMEITGFT